MENAEQELKRRRERGRVAQAALRKRQAKAAQEIQHENGQLREALSAITNVACRDDRSDLLAVIRQAADASGIDTSHLELSNSSSSKGESETDYANHGSKPVFKATRCMMWLNPMRYMRINDPPEDIIPYLGPAANTLAGKLFWAVLEHAISNCHHVHHPTAHGTLHRNPSFKRMVEHTTALGDVSDDFMRAMIEARLEYRKLGFISAEYASAAEPDAGRVMRRKVVEDYMKRGENADVWLNPMAVEARAREILGSHGFTKLKHAAESPNNNAQHTILSSAVNKLIEHYMCFGDGPRWNIEVVDGTFTKWRPETTK
ncbi:hypothetical protein BKA67DRAFT_235138 [Truncatella angustata]|uniref:Uncharacterized protein n=1 Tax=Truncatella angustata TaxID=152316 RepID=A0A9P8UND5_9PEZI|nr:uncharacterized protein BKA67DRAFT_235138 [Truncatella angustata]KAH6655382.1 hypothetical protein BKA67DRAFT_235138 [Truncatella angustata]